jgi:tryptophan-rich hypothetical protein
MTKPAILDRDCGFLFYAPTSWRFAVPQQSQRVVRPCDMNRLNPKKLLLSKWTAVTPVAKQKHFLVSKVIEPEPPQDPIKFVELEAVFSKTTRLIPWRDLQNANVWRQGWV